MKILITGASGFIGGALARLLHEDGHQVRATGRNAEKLRALEDMETRRGNLLDKIFVRDLCSGVDAVVHCAAHVAEYGTLKQFIPDTLDTTKNLLEAANETSAAQFLFISSPSVLYGPLGGINRHENDVLPNWRLPPYARAKLMAEEIVQNAANHFNSTWILRPQAVFGKGEPHFFERLLSISQRRGIPIVGDGEHMIDVTAVETVIHAISHFLNLSRPGLSVCNISNGDPRPFKRLIQQLFSACGEDVHFSRIRPVPVLALAFAVEQTSHLLGRSPFITPASLSKILYPRTLDSSFAYDELGLVAPLSLDETIEQYARWWKTRRGSS